MNDSKNSSNGLLVLKLSGQVSDKKLEELTEVIRPTADALGVEPMVLPAGVDVELQMGSSALLERVCAALEEIAAQGRAPEVSAEQVETPVLNRRPSGLNSRPTATDTLKADMERSFHEREHRNLGEFITNLGKPTDG